MNGINENMSTKILNNLVLTDLNNDNEINLPVAFTKTVKSWPFSKSDKVCQNDIKDLNYMVDVPFNFVDADITVLIGMNVPSLFKYTETVERNLNEPFASKHLYGWVLNGPVAGDKSNVHCHRSKVNHIDDLSSDREIFLP